MCKMLIAFNQSRQVNAEIYGGIPYLSKSSIEFPLLAGLAKTIIHYVSHFLKLILSKMDAFNFYGKQLPLKIVDTEVPKYTVRLGRFHIHALGTSIGLRLDS